MGACLGQARDDLSRTLSDACATRSVAPAFSVDATIPRRPVRDGQLCILSCSSADRSEAYPFPPVPSGTEKANQSDTRAFSVGNTASSSSP